MKPAETNAEMYETGTLKSQWIYALCVCVFVNDEQLNDAAIKTNEEIKQWWNRHVYNMMLPQNYLKYAVSETEKNGTIKYVRS